jgi:hypothetical protein
MRVYLSGGMEYADGEGVNWRKEMQEWLETTLNHSVFNPNVESDMFFNTRYPNIDFRLIKRTNLVLYQEIVRHLVDIDCKEIANHSDYLICYWDEGAAKGAGTKGELTMAKYFEKPVYLVTSFPHYDIPGWVLGCTMEIFPNFELLKQFLLRQ